MRSTKYYILSILMICFVTNAIFAQQQDLAIFKTTIKKVPEDSLLTVFESRIQELQKNSAADQLIVDFANFQLEVADSLKSTDLKKSALMALVKYPDLIEKNKLTKHFIKIGDYENRAGNYDVGIQYHYDAIKLAEELKNDTVRAIVFYRMGITYTKTQNYPLAKQYLFSAVEINEKLSDSLRLAGNFMSLGNCYKNSEIYDTATVFYNKSLDIGRLINSERTISGNYNNLGNVSRINKEFTKAEGYYLKAIEINKKIGNKKSLSHNYNNLGVTYKMLKKYDKALTYYEESLKLKDELGYFESKISTKENISEVYQLKGNYKLAYQNLSEAEALREEFESQEKFNLTASLEAKFQNEKKEALLQQLKAEQDLQEVTFAAQEKKFALQSQIKTERQKLLVVLIVVIISLLLGVFLFWRNAIQRKKYVATLHQKNNQIRTVNNNLQQAQNVLTEKNNEITDSITYAKRIQAAILPSQKTLENTLENAFVLYLPKDIVAGDFYWTEQVEDKVLFAVADCTGHGVPGAMVSVICNNALNASIKNDKLTDPGAILDNTTDIVLGQFAKSEEEVKDGMDIGLCAYDKKSKTLSFSGANIPLWLVRDGKVIEYKASRQPIGKHIVRRPFETNEIKIQNNDIVYLSSDGFADQFGGSRNKKYMKKKFKALLSDIGDQSIAIQNEMISTVFVDWKAANEQVDDICVMGIRFTV